MPARWGPRHPRTSRSHLHPGVPSTPRGSPTHAPTRQTHSRTLIRPSLDTWAFSNLPCAITSVYHAPDPHGPTAACYRKGFGSLSGYPLTFRWWWVGGSSLVDIASRKTACSLLLVWHNFIVNACENSIIKYFIIYSCHQTSTSTTTVMSVLERHL